MWRRFVRWLRGERAFPVCQVAEVIRAEVWALAAHRGWTDAERDAAVARVVGLWDAGRLPLGGYPGEYVLRVDELAERHVESMRRGML